MLEAPMTDIVSEGGCLCGAVRYRITGEPRSSSTCFCRSCRLASGATPVPWLVVGLVQYALLSGQLATVRSSPQVVRSFCARCGTPISYHHQDDAETLDLTTATLDQPERFPPTKEIWHESKVAWARSDPALARFSRDSDGPRQGEARAVGQA
jgi:hypothetical protein